jgi:DNA gyrase subunit A
VVTRRTQFELRSGSSTYLEGLIIASDNIDEVIVLKLQKYRRARERLIERFKLSDIQSAVEMRLRQLTGLEQDKLRTEYDEIMKLII